MLGVGAEDTLMSPADQGEPHVSLRDTSCGILDYRKGAHKAVLIWYSKARAKILSGPCFDNTSSKLMSH